MVCNTSSVVYLEVGVSLDEVRKLVAISIVHLQGKGERTSKTRGTRHKKTECVQTRHDNDTPYGQPAPFPQQGWVTIIERMQHSNESQRRTRDK